MFTANGRIPKMSARLQRLQPSSDQSQKHEQVKPLTQPKLNRTLITDPDFCVPVLRCSFAGLIEIDGCRNIIWKHDETGQVWHQDCTTVVHPDHPGKSVFYNVHD